MTTIAKRLDTVRMRIKQAAEVAGRDPDTITLLAVSKRKPLEDVIAALACGQQQFGENYVQEGVEKIQGLSRCQPDSHAQWHLIGPLQSNKTAVVAQHFDWVQSIDRLKIARRLSEQRPDHLKPLQVCIQVNISGEDSKSGVAAADALALAAEVATLPRLTLRGLMAIPQATTDNHQQHQAFAAMQALFRQLQAQHPQADTLSLGMSDDLEAAIMEGATLVRLGTTIFGARTN
ncbi:YggS family pyridoxal phosphate-dependent enzyme [Gallaecimonas sp. GXIMD1310]|uniref:YggS family pyridoxal phosphate-dependent enzyme n=1 Tax=Gallaecimonas sp. GXIMD1310 TaxID=3131926 RepID=UPI00324AEEAD